MRGRTIVAAVAALLLAAPGAGAAVLFVDDDSRQCPTAGFTSIQAAVDVSTGGEDIRVCQGVYREAVRVDAGHDGITLRAYKTSRVMLVTPADAPGVLVRADDVTIDRFQIRPEEEAAGEVGVAGLGAGLTVLRSRIWGFDGGVFTSGAESRVSGNDVTAYSGDGIQVVGPRSLVAANDIFVLRGTALRVGAATTAIGNETAGGDTGIFVDGGTVVRSNVAYGASVGIRGSSFSNGEPSTLRSNVVFGNGGAGVFLEFGVTGWLVDRNHARGNGQDCRDDSVGGGTAGTANTWTGNRGDDSAPPGLCKP